MKKKVDTVFVRYEEWEAFKRYLLIDIKLSSSYRSIEGNKSRFKFLVKAFEDKPFDRKEFSDILYTMKENKYSAAYINNIIKIAKHFDKYKNFNVLQDFTYFKEKSKPVDALTPDEIYRLAEIEIPWRINPAGKNYLYKTLIYFLATTGCRLHEALDLRWSNTTEDIVKFEDTKNGEDRIVPLSLMVSKLIQGLPRGIYVFGTERKLDDTYVRDNIKQRAKACGITKPIYPHVFRHSYITEMIKSGVSISYISRIVGHKDLQSTNHYTQLVVEDLREAIYMHPLLRQTLTLEKISERVDTFLGKIIDSTKYSLTVVRESGSLQVVIKSLPAS